MQSVSQHDFARIPSPRIQRSKFDRSSGFKTTADAGQLFPIFFDEALPGDTFNLNTTFFCRLNTPIVPIMDNMYLETFFFEVPVRQVWANWQKFNGEQLNPGESTDFLIPQITSPAVVGHANGSIYDYFGIPTEVPDLEHSALPLRAYNLIYNEWFRDQNLITRRPSPTTDGPDVSSNYIIMPRGKRHDYFTSALPWPQKSDSGSVSIPLGTSAPVYGIGIPDTNTTFPQGPQGVIESGGQTNTYTDARLIGPTTAENVFLQGSGAVGGFPTIYADLSDATAATINQLRQSISIQRMFERDARGGTRYIEVIKSHFGVDSPDLRLQRPGYLGGGRSQINISPIAQTQASSVDVTPQGNLAAIGTVQGSGHSFTRSFTEHTMIIGLACIRADLTYQRGLERSWSRKTRFDFFWPELATLGEQEVLRKEIYATGDPTNDETVFGYQERFAEYRYKPSLITGLFRSTAPQSLDFWHLSQDFTSAPVLGPAFINESPPVDRVVATPDEPHFKMDAYFNLNCVRPMPMYGIPGLDRL